MTIKIFGESNTLILTANTLDEVISGLKLNWEPFKRDDEEATRRHESCPLEENLDG